MPRQKQLNFLRVSKLLTNTISINFTAFETYYKRGKIIKHLKQIKCGVQAKLIHLIKYTELIFYYV